MPLVTSSQTLPGPPSGRRGLQRDAHDLRSLCSAFIGFRPKVLAIVDRGKAKRRPRCQVSQHHFALKGQTKCLHGGVEIGRSLDTGYRKGVPLQGEDEVPGALDRGRRFALPPPTMEDAFGVNGKSRWKHRRTSWSGTDSTRRKSATKFAINFLLAFGVALLAGCAVGPNYKRPAIDSPAAFRSGTSATNEPAAELAWWVI